MRRLALGAAAVALIVAVATVAVVNRRSGSHGSTQQPVAPAASSSAALVYSATCSGDSLAPADWQARYEVRAVGSDTTVKVLSIGSQPVTDAGLFTLSWNEGTPMSVTGSAERIEALEVPASEARLLTADGACSLFLWPGGPAAPNGVDVVGDSVIEGLGQSISAGGVGSAAGRPWIFVGAPGEGWAGVPGMLGSGAEHLVRGLVAEHPEALVLSFGTNDALHAVLASVTGGAAAAEQVRRDTEASITQVLGKIAAAVPCVLLVTPSNWPSQLFGAGINYSWGVKSIVDRLRTLAGTTADQVISVVDWARDSLLHHLPDASPGDWFPDGDEVHPNPAGLAALQGMIASTLNSACGLRAPATG